MNRIARTSIITLTVCILILTVTGGFLFLVLAKPHWSASLYLMNHLITQDNPPQRPVHFTGTWRMWNEEGTLIYKGCYEDGLPVGTHYSWWPDGSKQSVEVHDAWEITRAQMWYPADDQGHSQLYVDSDKTSDPLRVVMYYESGQKKEEIIRSNTNDIWMMREWDEEGNLVSEVQRRIGEGIQQSESSVPEKAAQSASSPVR